MAERRAIAPSELQDFFTLSPDLWGIVESEGTFRLVNPAWEQQLGWTWAQLTANPWIAWIHPNDVEITRAAIRRSQGSTWESRCRHSAGHYRWFAWTLIQRKQGLLYLIAKDITASKQSEFQTHEQTLRLQKTFNLVSPSQSGSTSAIHEADTEPPFCELSMATAQQTKIHLQSDEVTNRVLLEIIPDLMIRMDRNGNYLDYIPAENFKSIKPQAEMVGKNIFQILPEAIATERMWFAQQALATKTVQMYEYRLQIGDELRDQEARLVPSGTDEVLVVVRDITDRQRTVEALRQSEQQFHTLAEVSPVGIFHIDLTGCCLYANQRWFNITSKTPEETIGRDWISQLDSNDQDRVTVEWHWAVQQNLSFSSEYRFQRLDETTVWVFGQIVPEYDAADRLVGYVGTITDISDRKRIEEALQENQRTLSTLMGSLPGMAYRSELNFHQPMKFVSAGCLELTGYPSTTFMSAPDFSYLSLLKPEDQARRTQTIQAAFQMNQPYHLTYQITTSSGIEKWVWEKGQAVASVEADEPMLAGFITDITDRKRIGEALQESEQRFQAIFNQTFQLCWLLTPDGILLEANQTALDFCQLQSAQVIEQPFWNTPWWTVSPDAQIWLKEAIAQAKLGNFVRHEVELLSFMQEKATIDFSLTPVKDPHDQVTLLIAEGHDVSDRQQAEAALKSLVEGTAAVTGADFFAALVRHLAQVLGVRHAIVTQQTGANTLQTLAVYSNQQLQPNFVFDSANTPCEFAIRDGSHHCAENLQQQFPDNEYFRVIHAESYLGVSLLNNAGQAIGNLCVLDNKPILKQVWCESILHIFAARAAAELERQQAQTELQQFNQQLEFIVDERTQALRHTNALLRQEILDRQHVEAALRKSEEMLLRIAANVPGMIYQFLQKSDGSQSFVYASSGCYDLCGLGPEVILQDLDAVWSAIHPEDLSTLQSTIQESAETLQPWRWEGRIQTPSGLIKWVQGISRPERVQNNGILWDGLLVDISDRKQAEAAQQESEYRFERIFEDAPIGMAIADLEGHFLEANATLCQLLNYTEAELRDRTFLDITHPADQPQLMEAFQAGLAGKQDFITLEKRYITQQQETIWVAMTASLIRDLSGHPLYCLSMMENITERKQSEEVLRRQLAAIEAASDGIAVLNLQGEYLYLNQAHVEMMGYSNADELIGQSWQIFYEREEQIYFNEEVFPYLRHIGRWQGETTALKRDGTTFPEEVSLTWIENIGLICVCRNITKRKQVEEETRKTLARERELSELKSRFISMTSHEFRTPLTVIGSSADILETYSHKLTEETKKVHLQRIQGAVKHMTQLLEDVLTINRADVGKLRFYPEPLDLQEFCQNLIDETRLNAQQKFETSLSSTLPAAANGEPLQPWIDKKLLQQILNNLLSNAVKYSPPNSTIRFELSYYQHSALFRIADQGIGIPPKDQETLFDAFHRADNVGSIPGTGLGLSVVKRCVELHGGEIAVVSEVEQGTTFTVQLPLRSKA